MLRIIRYILFDLLRSRWTYVYFLFYLLLASVMLFLNNDVSKAIITLLNIVLVLTPMVGVIFGVMHYYNSMEFTRLLLAQPIKRSTIFIGQFLGLTISLALSLVLGLGLPFLFYGLFYSSAIWDFSSLILVGVLLTSVFVSLAYLVALSNENRIKGFGYAILLWLFFAVLYDGVFLVSLLVFDDYPLEGLTLSGVLLNPIDLSRILILMKLDISALFGFTGASFKKFFGSSWGMMLSFTALSTWAIIPVLFIKRIVRKKDF